MDLLYTSTDKNHGSLVYSIGNVKIRGVHRPSVGQQSTRTQARAHTRAHIFITNGRKKRSVEYLGIVFDDAPRGLTKLF